MDSVFRVFVYLRRYPALAAATLGCAILTTLSGFVFPKVTGYIIDNVIETGRADRLLPCALLIALAFFARDAFNCLRIRFNNQFEGNVIRDLRNDLYDHLQRLPLGWFEKRSTGDLMTRVSEDVTNVERVLIDGVEQGIVALLQIVGIGVILFQKNVVLAAWMLLPLPLLFGGALWYTLTAGGRYKEQRRAASALNSILLDNLGGIRQIKSFAREGEESRRFDGVAERAKQAQILVSQENFLFNTTIRANLLFGRPGASEADVHAAAVAAHADEFIRALPQGYDTEIGERGVKLSGGEKQRLAIARALLKDPPILILDEATASVDTLTEKLIAEALAKLLAHRTSFIIAHRLSTIRHADVILVMKGGRIIERGSHNELLAEGGLYAKLATAQRSDLLEDEAFV